MTQWAVLIEQNKRVGEYDSWTLHEGRRVADRAEGVELAEELALSHHPGLGTTELGRSVFRVSESEWLVVVEGRWQDKVSFRLTIAEHVGDYPAPKPL